MGDFEQLAKELAKQLVNLSEDELAVFLMKLMEKLVEGISTDLTEKLKNILTFLCKHCRFWCGRCQKGCVNRTASSKACGELELR